MKLAHVMNAAMVCTFTLDASTFWVDYYSTHCGIVYLATMLLEIQCEKAFA